jgi:hypothetical protein
VGLQFGPYFTAFNEFSKFYSVAVDTRKYRANKSIGLLSQIPTAFILLVTVNQIMWRYIVWIIEYANKYTITHMNIQLHSWGLPYSVPSAYCLRERFV